MDVLAKQANVPLLCIGQHFSYRKLGDYWEWQYHGHNSVIASLSMISRLPMPSLPIENAATALMAIALMGNKLNIAEEHVRNGLQKANLPGRFTKVNYQNDKWVYLDVAHNPAAANWLAVRLHAEKQKQNYKRIHAVVGMLGDKDILGTLESLFPLIDSWFVADLPTARAASSKFIQQQLEVIGVHSCYTFPSVEKALDAVFSRAEQGDCVIVFGSFYTVADALQCLQ